MAAGGVNQCLPLLSASHLGNVTSTVPPYVQESSPRGDMKPKQFSSKLQLPFLQKWTG
uniref:Uncharacterized protein n=1 Tax=Capra hircus TaxID=9925 RepID=A0A8C2NH19_CAPHI